MRRGYNKLEARGKRGRYKDLLYKLLKMSIASIEIKRYSLGPLNEVSGIIVLPVPEYD